MKLRDGGHAGVARDGERGFSLIELLVAIGIFATVAGVALLGVKQAAVMLGRSYAADGGAASIEAQMTQWQSDAASAFAIFVPQVDVRGAPNGDGHELDFYARTQAGVHVFWCYRYNAASRGLQRFDYDRDANGGVAAVGVRDIHTGAIIGNAQYPAIGGVRSFVARALDAGDLVTDKAAYGAVFAGLPAPRSLPVSFNDATLNDPDVIGGNRVVQVSVAGVGSARTMHLMSGTLPSGFTVVGAPVWHAIVYRRDQSHRFVFGLAGRSHVWINAHVSVSYDNWAHAKQWCDFNLYGNPNGLDPGDVHSKYLPNDPAETAQSIIDRCRNTEGHPTPPPPEAPDEGVYH